MPRVCSICKQERRSFAWWLEGRTTGAGVCGECDPTNAPDFTAEGTKHAFTIFITAHHLEIREPEE